MQNVAFDSLREALTSGEFNLGKTCFSFLKYCVSVLNYNISLQLAEIGFFFLNSYIFPINAAAKSLREGKLIDPCTPKGYLHNAESWKLAPGLLDEKNGLSTLQSNGNFSECRSAALLMLQKGKG